MLYTKFVLTFFLSILIGCSASSDKESSISLTNTNDSENTSNPTVRQSAKQTNIDIGNLWMDEQYYQQNPHSEPLLPNGCTQFDDTFYVSTNGDDTNNGSQQAPFKTIQHALLQTDPNNCSLVRVAPGEYKEALNLTAWSDGSGTRVFNKITLFGEDRKTTKLISKKSYFYYDEEPSWEKLSPQECPNAQACNIYKKRFDPYSSVSDNINFNGHLNANTFFHYKDKIVIPVHVVAKYGFQEVVQPSDLKSGTDYASIANADTFIKNDYSELTTTGAKNYRDLLLEILNTDSSYMSNQGSGVLLRNDHSWDDLGSAYFTYLDHDESGNKFSYIYFRPFDDEQNPSEYLTTHIMYNFYIVGQSNIVIQNLHVQNGRYGISVSRNSHNIKIVGNTFKNNFKGVYLYGDTYGSPSNIEIYGNKISNNYDLNYSPQSKSAYRNFILLKETVGDSHGISLLNHGSNINIHHNFIHNVANGIQSYTADSTTYPESNLLVHHNLIINTIDDALEPGGDCHECHWYSNHLRNTSQSIRLKLTDNVSRGPIYIYKNVFYNQGKFEFENELHYGNQTSFYFHTPSEVPIYVYNNLFLGFRCLLPPTSAMWKYNPDGTLQTDSDGNTINKDMKMYFINNILSCRYSMPNISYGTWPLYYFNGDNSTPRISQKNKQPLLSHNWIGGIVDHRETNGTKAFHQNDRTYLFAQLPDTNSPHNPELNEDLNFIHKASIGETATHIFDSFDADNNGDEDILKRKDFCPPTSTYPELINGGLDITDSQNLSWNYIQRTDRYSTSYLHQIDRSISQNLPGVSFPNDNIHIGPFASTNSSCHNLDWLLEP
jgi:parallel beta-helix repeat protein